MYGGAPVVGGQFGSWTPIGAEQTSSGYEVAWKIPGSSQYEVWYTDGSGNHGYNTGILSGTSTTLEQLETSFHQDLNGDGVIGIPALSGTVMKFFGSTSLVEELRELSEEGAAQVFYAESETGPAPIVGAVGQLQFDVMLFRLTNEYGAPCRFQPISYRYPRWVTGPAAAIERAGTARGRLRLYDTKGAPLLLFENEWSLRWALENEKELTFHDVAP